MSGHPVAGAASGPALGRSGFDLGGMFGGVAPVAEAFQVRQGVVHRVPVAMVDLAAPCFTASLAGLGRLDAFGGVAGARAGLGLTGWV